MEVMMSWSFINLTTRSVAVTVLKKLPYLLVPIKLRDVSPNVISSTLVKYINPMVPARQDYHLEAHLSLLYLPSTCSINCHAKIPQAIFIDNKSTCRKGFLYYYSKLGSCGTFQNMRAVEFYTMNHEKMPLIQHFFSNNFQQSAREN